jgi:hypothetical protein
MLCFCVCHFQSCGKRLACGNHLCEEICHSGKCGSCPRSGVRKCPCGKTSEFWDFYFPHIMLQSQLLPGQNANVIVHCVSLAWMYSPCIFSWQWAITMKILLLFSAYELPCTEDIPTCGDTCGQLLQCGMHNCTQRCHLGPCGQVGLTAFSTYKVWLVAKKRNRVDVGYFLMSLWLLLGLVIFSCLFDSLPAWILLGENLMEGVATIRGQTPSSINLLAHIHKIIHLGMVLQTWFDLT